MHGVFLACLVGGALATTLFALLGVVGGAHVGGHAQVHHGGSGHFHSGHGGHAPGDATPGARIHHIHGSMQGRATGDSSGVGQAVPQGHQAAPQTSGVGWGASLAGWTLSWFSPLTLAAAALWFGGVGLLLEGPLGPLVILVAVLAALAGAALVRGLMNALVRASTPPLTLNAEGAIATVNAAIRADAPGEVVYTLEGLHRSIPAWSEDGRPIPRGVPVVILRRERGFAWVAALDPLDDGSPTGPSLSQEGTHRQ